MSFENFTKKKPNLCQKKRGKKKTQKKPKETHNPYQAQKNRSRALDGDKMKNPHKKLQQKQKKCQEEFFLPLLYCRKYEPYN